MTRKIPSTMISQHPDHASKPYWLEEEFIGTHNESKECFLSFSELGSSEYKWDWEGKLVDESVVERLFMDHYDYFQKYQLGKEKFLTFRLPNPRVESEYRLGRAFMGLLSAAGLAKGVGLHTPPLFEAILPMTESAKEIIEIQEAFAEISSLKHRLNSSKNGSLKHVELIPLFEKVDTIIRSDEILNEYIDIHKKKFGRQPDYIRPYIARSDPALNSGLIPTVLAIKMALSRYRRFESVKNIKLYPIIGSASLPFRGGLTPETIGNFTREYGGVRTALLQSAFRYDYDKDKVIKAIKELESILPYTKAVEISKVEETKLMKTISLLEKDYKETVEEIATIINDIASKLPKRRERVQHIGLFGYSRGVGRVKLPRAIGFTGALYSLGVPPEIIGTGRGLKKAEELTLLKYIEQHYLNLKQDLIKAGLYLNKDNLYKLSCSNPIWTGVMEDVKYIEQFLGKELGPQNTDHVEHCKITGKIFKLLVAGKDFSQELSQAAVLRKSIG
ncbi:phosphoenolpyruvate carboxylase [Candidatus Woesebacteria bacterium RIFCSPLOWO2_01_FULL_39_23]|uniref:Phosphoenolpyruvate carboxylase n=1 Tax=Candidatus Woesebacteria bacterium RIFCSPHIGHO2_01_FULL_40_22 TaxID=1802499 RepID=A0A1F7YJA1_9BACT|nr:MAG: phosphoenolpyruvate carboxylase [Candidatus Woesebacteria bacterium RIFCSPHIGHO2_01_FULL_40_22]OGM62596.1 MAG: phosphoenolpyruvate carboxylase [Candidatus Woesebacteria bacterium RIFCSPLOWO2_01_FULL_39_23]